MSSVGIVPSGVKEQVKERETPRSWKTLTALDRHNSVVRHSNIPQRHDLGFHLQHDPVNTFNLTC